MLSDEDLIELDHLMREYEWPWREQNRKNLPQNEHQWLQIFPEARPAYMKTLKQKLFIEQQIINHLENAIKQNEINRSKAFSQEQWLYDLELELLENELIHARQSQRHIKFQLNPVRKKDSSPQIDQASIENAKQVPIQSYFPGKLRVQGSRLVGICPFHSERTGSFTIYTNNNTWYCFGGCSQGGDLIDFLMKLHKISFIQAVKLILNM